VWHDSAKGVDVIVALPFTVAIHYLIKDHRGRQHGIYREMKGKVMLTRVELNGERTYCSYVPSL